MITLVVEITKYILPKRPAEKDFEIFFYSELCFLESNFYNRLSKIKHVNYRNYLLVNSIFYYYGYFNYFLDLFKNIYY